jgi:hypothetical protein
LYAKHLGIVKASFRNERCRKGRRDLSSRLIVLEGKVKCLQETRKRGDRFVERILTAVWYEYLNATKPKLVSLKWFREGGVALGLLLRLM